MFTLQSPLRHRPSHFARPASALTMLAVLVTLAAVARPAAAEGERWAQIHASGDIRGRDGAVSVLDPVRNRMIVVGGLTSSAAPADLVALNLDIGKEAWIKLNPTGPQPNVRVSDPANAIFDTPSDRMVVQVGDDWWTLNFGTGDGVWQQLALGARLPKGTQGSVVYQYWDRPEGEVRRAILFGGNYLAGRPKNEVWALNLVPGAETWSRLKPGGTGPAEDGTASLGSSPVYDPDRHRLLMFGSERSGQKSRGFVWVLDLTPGAESWSRLDPAGAADIEGASFWAVMDPCSGAGQVIFIGQSRGDVRMEARSLTLSDRGHEVLRLIDPAGTRPPDRGAAVTVFDGVGRRLILALGGKGGSAPGAILSDAWGLEFSACEATAATPGATGTPTSTSTTTSTQVPTSLPAESPTSPPTPIATEPPTVIATTAPIATATSAHTTSRIWLPVANKP